MIVDPSALAAILKGEPEADEIAARLDSSDNSKMSAAGYFECGIVIDSLRNPILSSRLDEVIERFHIQIEPVTPEQSRIARLAYRDYGKGSGHPAQLNFGDCFSYALARDKREAILFKGDDLAHTDLRSALEG